MDNSLNMKSKLKHMDHYVLSMINNNFVLVFGGIRIKNHKEIIIFLFGNMIKVNLSNKLILKNLNML